MPAVASKGRQSVSATNEKGMSMQYRGTPSAVSGAGCYPPPIRTNTSIYAMSYTTHSALVIMACNGATTRAHQSGGREHDKEVFHTSGAKPLNVLAQARRATVPG